MKATETSPKPSRNGAGKPITASAFDPDEIRRIVELGKQRGLIRGPSAKPAQAQLQTVTPVPGEKAAIAKTGRPAADLGKVRSQWMDVTPQMAADWLKNNFGNRPLKHDVVEAYARDMAHGVWVPTHQGLAFNDEDDLIDGQHRLHAITLSKCTVRMMVTFDLPSRIEGKEMTTMDAVDRGAQRSVADQLTIQHGFKNGGVTSRICGSLGGICFGERTRRLSVGQTLEIFRAFESAVLYVIEHGSKKPGLRAIGVAAGFAFALMTEERFWESASRIADFHKGLMTGEGLAEGTAIRQLREFLTGAESALFTRTMDRGMAELVLQAIHCDLQGRRNVKLTAVTEGADYFRKLQPERVAKIAALFNLPEPPAPAAKPPVKFRQLSEAERNSKIFNATPAPAKPAAAPEDRKPKHQH